MCKMWMIVSIFEHCKNLFLTSLGNTIMLTSTHSVAPIKPYSSASQLHKIMVRPGLQSARVGGVCVLFVGEEGEGERELDGNRISCVECL